ncbi:unnamed protein product [Albugo candida]|uniref:Uncharacterized protein n=1 Tax=Albugo candida TaxID=65357 RepID=A0A024GMB0_9STRA|nr:unnamed protein product [Albugo candida]|eukprot:CCI47892.1 unnamed protein product [Albugo candida]
MIEVANDLFWSSNSAIKSCADMTSKSPFGTLQYDVIRSILLSPPCAKADAIRALFVAELSSSSAFTETSDENSILMALNLVNDVYLCFDALRLLISVKIAASERNCVVLWKMCSVDPWLFQDQSRIYHGQYG